MIKNVKNRLKSVNITEEEREHGQKMKYKELSVNTAAFINSRIYLYFLFSQKSLCSAAVCRHESGNLPYLPSQVYLYLSVAIYYKYLHAEICLERVHSHVEEAPI